MEHSKEFPDSFFRVTVKGLCVREGKILLLKENRRLSGKWEMPGGGVEELESLDFVPSEECEAIGFFTKDELKDQELNGQTNELLKIFNPADFEGPF